METNVPVRMHPNIEQAMANELMMTTKLRNGKRPRTTKREGRRVISPVRPFVDCVPYRFFPSSGTRRLDPHRSQGLRHLDLRDEHRVHRAAGERWVATACMAGGFAATPATLSTRQPSPGLAGSRSIAQYPAAGEISSLDDRHVCPPDSDRCEQVHHSEQWINKPPRH